MERRLRAIEDKLANADPLARLQLVQERMDLQAELAAGDNAVNLTELEAAFIQSAAPYGKRKGITYAAWREARVDPSVLRAASIRRGD